MINKAKTAIIIVLYHPDENKIFSLLENINKYVDKIILIDNTPNYRNQLIEQECIGDPLKYTYIALNKNTGISYAQNIGIKIILDNPEFKYVTFFDQDSTPPNNFVETLERSIRDLETIGEHKVAAVAPIKINRHTKLPYKSRYTSEVDYLDNYSIRKVVSSSGMMIPTTVLQDIGLMDEELFIDYVDYEWCWRATAKGYKVFIIKNLNMEHEFGQGEKNILFWKIKISSPERIYYQFRNAIKMINRSYVPVSFKLECIIDNLIKSIIYSVLISPQRLYLKNIITGTVDGIMNKNRNKK